MKCFHKLLLGICHSSCILLVGSDGNLRGTNTTLIQDNEVSTEYEMHQHRNTSAPIKFVVLPSRGTSMERRTSLKERKRSFRIHGLDDRRGFKDKAWPWSAVGKVETAKGSCTGTMVGTNLMLTAQHCLDRRADGSVGWMKFTPAYYDEHAPFGSAYAEHGWYDLKIPRRNKYYETEFAWDYAVVRLNWHIGEKTGNWGFREYKRRWNGRSYWRHIGYGDISDGQRPLYHHTSSIHSARSYFTPGGTKSLLMKHSIDSSKGHSGGPVFGFFKNAENESMPYIIGVHVGGSGLASGGRGLYQLIHKLKMKEIPIYGEPITASHNLGTMTGDFTKRRAYAIALVLSTTIFLI